MIVANSESSMYKVQFKVSNAFQAWANYGSYSSEASALNVASRLSTRYFMVRVISNHSGVVYTS